MDLKCFLVLLICYISELEAAVPLLMSWTSSIKMINNHDSSAEPTVAAVIPTTTHAIAVDYHYRRNEVYFSDALGRIYRGRLSGGSEVVVVLEVRLTDGLAVDWLHDNLYWTDVSGRTLEMAALDGTDRRVLFDAQDGLEKPRGIVVDPTQGLLFWTDWGAKARVESSGLDGKDRKTIVSSNLVWPNGIAADLQRRTLYILDGLKAELFSCSYDGSHFASVQKSSVNMLQSFGVTFFNNKVYWGSWASHTLFSYDVNTKASASVLKRSDGLRIVRERMMGVKAVDVSLQPVAGGDPCALAESPCEHTCLVGRDRKKSCICHYGYALNSDGRTCTEQGYLLLSWRKTLRRYDLNGSSQQALLDGSAAAISIGYHLHKGLIFWSDIEEHRIYRAPLEQLNNKSVVAVPETCDGLAVDWVHDVLYWSDTDRNTIHAARLDGSNQTALVSDSLDQPRDIAVDPLAGFIFWTDWGRNPKLERAVLDGSDRRALVTADLSWPNGITLDMPGKTVYWVDGKLSTISSCSYGGTNKKIILSPQEFSEQPFSISFFRNIVYWTDWRSQAIYKADTTSMTISTRMANSSSIFLRPNGVKVVHSSLQPEELNPCADMRCSGLCLGRMPKNGLPSARCLGEQIATGESDCMTDLLACDAKKDCPDGSDEDLRLCAGIDRIFIYKKSVTEVFLRMNVSTYTKKQLDKFVGNYNIANSKDSISFSKPLEPCVMWPQSYCFSINSLTKNKMYNFSVSAYIKGGQVGESVLLSTRTTEGIPGPPESVRVVNYTATSVELQWAHPNEANGIIRNFTVNIQELETFDETQCCQTFPELHTPVTSDEPVYGVEIAGLQPASTYGVLIASKTAYVGTSKEMEVNTPPPALRLLHAPPTVRAPGVNALTWTRGQADDRADQSGKYDHLIRSYLLLVIPMDEKLDLANSHRVSLGPLLPSLEAKFGMHFAVMWQKKADETDELVKPIELTLENEIKFKAVWVQVTEHKGAYGLDAVESTPFTPALPY